MGGGSGLANSTYQTCWVEAVGWQIAQNNGFKKPVVLGGGRQMCNQPKFTE